MQSDSSLAAASGVGRAQVLAAALLFSTGGAVVKLATVGAWEVALGRSAVAAVALLALVPSSRRLGDPASWLVGLAYAATLTLFVHANKLTTAAGAIFLQATAPLYVALLSPLLLGERAERRHLVLLPPLLICVALFFVGLDPVSETAPDPLLGNLLAAGSGLAYALAILGLRALARAGATGPGRGTSAVAAGNLLAVLLCLPWFGGLGHWTALDWGAVAFLGVFQIGLAYLFLTRGLGRIGAVEASLLLMVEPVLSPLWAGALHGEPVGPATWLGGAGILAATVWLALSGRRARVR